MLRKSAIATIVGSMGVSLLSVAPAQAIEFRSIDGSGNNTTSSALDAVAHRPMLRLLDNAYDDGISTPRGGLSASTLPSPRLISNVVADQPALTSNFLRASDWLWQWGQFVDHDLDLTPVDPNPSAFDVPVPQFGDPLFNPMQLSNVTIPLDRSEAAPGTGTGVGNPRQHLNEITSYIDASVIYGSDASRATALRSTTNAGMLEVSMALNGEILPMKNSVGQPNETNGLPGADFYLSGDVRANEQIALTAAHTLFVREHNRLVSSLKQRLDAGEVDLVAKRDTAIADAENSVTDEGDFLYEAARKVVGAQIQKVTYEEFLPILIGNDLSAYAGYDNQVDATISNEFATAAFRVGHTLLSPTIKRPGVGDIRLQDAFFDPSEVEANGVDAVLAGLSQQEAQALDHQLIDGVRNFLFGPPGMGGLDLASLNVQRGRDHGLPSYVDAYGVIFNTSITSFADLGSAGFGLMDDSVVALLEQAYTSVDEIDLWIGGISELPDDHGGLLGPTFTFFLVDQFGRTRDGDRFFYEDDAIAEHLLMLDPSFDDLMLSEIILRNTQIGSLRLSVFIVPEPTTFALLAPLVLALTRRRRRG